MFHSKKLASCGNLAPRAIWQSGNLNQIATASDCHMVGDYNILIFLSHCQAATI